MKFRFSEKMVLILMIAVTVLLPLKSSFSIAQDNQDTQAASQTADTTVKQEDVIKQFKTNRFLDRIEREISSGEDDLLAINRQITDTQDKIDATLDEINTLQAQLDSLDKQIRASEQIISNVEAQIQLKESEIETLEYEVEQKKVEISFQKQLISEYLKVLFKDQNDFSSLTQDGSDLNTLKLLLSDGNTSEKLRSIRYSEVLEEQGRMIFEKLGELMDEQEADQKIMEVKKVTLIQFHQKLTDEQNDLKFKKQAKENLLTETKGQEDIYQQLLSRSKAQQEDVLLEIETLRKNMAFVKERIKQLGSKFNPEDYASLLNVGNNKNLLAYLTYGLENGEFLPAWPVKPVRGISAYFHESSYARLFGMQHNAVDIRTGQGTPVGAAADGIVYKAVDNGYGYSYIMIAHAGGYMTLYGHISEIMVREGDELKQGDVIGLSGGIPGTKGAGVYTTGPHLHFEVIKDGYYVDPLNYLNLAFLDFQSLPEKYVDKALGDRSKIRRLPIKAKVRNNSRDNVTGEVSVQKTAVTASSRN